MAVGGADVGLAVKLAVLDRVGLAVGVFERVGVALAVAVGGTKVGLALNVGVPERVGVLVQVAVRLGLREYVGVKVGLLTTQPGNCTVVVP